MHTGNAYHGETPFKLPLSLIQAADKCAIETRRSR